jgi:hypothetical protein
VMDADCGRHGGCQSVDLVGWTHENENTQALM